MKHLLIAIFCVVVLSACGNTMSKALGSVKSILDIAPAIVEDVEKNMSRVEEAVDQDHGEPEDEPAE